MEFSVTLVLTLKTTFPDYNFPSFLKAVQGAFAEHIAILESLNNDSNTLYEEITVVQVKRFNHIFNIQHHEPIIDGLILPGGESTTMALIASKKLGEHELTLWDGIRIFGSEPFNRPIWVIDVVFRCFIDNSIYTILIYIYINS